MDKYDKLLSIVKLRGPLLPMHVTKELETTNMIASAMLSELVTKKVLRITSVKFGNSPFYYCSGQEQMLQELSKHLNEKDKRACDLLMEKKVLKDSSQEPLTRVSLRQIKDYAKPFRLGEEVFWRWYLLPEEEASALVTGKKKETPVTEIRKEEPKHKPKPGPVKQKKLVEEKKATGAFMEALNRYFTKNKIEIESLDVVRKDKEIDFIIKVPSTVGSLRYYSKAKNKKRISDSDLSSAYVKGEVKKLPVIFLISGDLTKKAKQMLDNEFKNIKIKKI